jgi:hypothetical protein
MIIIIIGIISLKVPGTNISGTTIINSKEHNTCTEIYIINGDHENEGWFDGPTKTELLQAFMEQPKHLFITPSLWKSFCSCRSAQIKNLEKEQISASLDNLQIIESIVYNKDNKKNGFSQDDDEFFNLATVVVFNEEEWNFYDTHAGLYYLSPKITTEDIGLNVELFTKIERPCSLAINPKVISWANGFMELFNLDKWHKIHQTGRKSIFCISGHGTSRTHKISRACGLPTKDFVKLMLFFNNTLKISTLGVQSCYWPSTRILALMNEHNVPHLNFQIITPIDQEREVFFAAEMPIVESYESRSQQKHLRSGNKEIFLTGLRDIALTFNGTLTTELFEKLNSLDVVQMNHKYNMKTSLLDTGSLHPVLV